MDLLRNLASRVSAVLNLSGGNVRVDVTEVDPIRPVPFELEPLEQDRTVIPVAASRAEAGARPS